MHEDEALRVQVSRRDTTAFEKVYSTHFVRVRNFLRVYLGNVSHVDDVTQDTFLQLWRFPNRFDPSRSNLKTYLFGIARKRAADWWRNHRHVEEPPPSPACREDDVNLLLDDLLHQLAPELRNVLWLREVEGYSYEELARILDVPLGTVKSRLFSAREQLRRLWKPNR